MKRRIAIISDHASPICPPGGIDSGGQNVYVARVAEGLVRLGWLVDVYTRRDSPALPLIHHWRENIRVIHVPAGPARVMAKEVLAGFMPDFARFMVQFIRRSRLHYDVVHANFWMSGLVAMRLKRDLGLPFVMTYHALGKVRRLHQGAADGFPDERLGVEEEIAATADRIVAECPQDFEDITGLYGADERRTTIVPCGVDLCEMTPEPASAARRKIGLEGEGPLVLQVGRLVPRKGVDNVIRGFAGFASGRSDRPTLMIVGGDSDAPDERLTPEIGRLRAVARECGVAGNVIFTGRRPTAALRTYYSAADVFVTTPWYEPFGITALEAMACATPVVAADVGGLKYSVVDGETGRLVPANDPHALARCLGELFRSPQDLRAMGMAGRWRVTESFQWSHIVDRLDRTYREVARRHPVRRPSAPRVRTAIDPMLTSLPEAV